MGPGNKPNILQLIAGQSLSARCVVRTIRRGGPFFCAIWSAGLSRFMPLPDRPNGRYARLRGGRPRCGGLPAQRFLCPARRKTGLLFPGSYKRSIVYGTEDAQGVVQRTAALSALRREMAAGEYRIICTYPEGSGRTGDRPRLDAARNRAGEGRRPAGDRRGWRSCWPIRGSRRWISFTNPDSIRCVAVSSTCFPFPRANLTGWTFSGRGGFDPPIRDFQSAFRRPAERGGDRSEPERFCRGSDFAARICRRGDLLVFRSRLRTAARERSASQGSGEMEEPAEIDTHLVSRKVLLQDMAGMRLFGCVIA